MDVTKYDTRLALFQIAKSAVYTFCNTRTKLIQQTLSEKKIFDKKKQIQTLIPRPTYELLTLTI